MCSGKLWRPWVFIVSLLALPNVVASQAVPPVGTDATFDVATWNIEWFGSTSNGPSDEAGQFDRVVETIQGAEIDLWAVQEIADTDVFDELMAALGNGYEGHLATNSTQQRIGFIFNTDVVRLRSLNHILESFEFEFASRPPLQLEADVTLGDTTVVVTFITVHMKAFGDLDSYNRRLDAGQRLKNHIDFSTLNREAVIVLGDFNDELTDSITGGQDTPYANFLNDSDDYLFLSLALEEAGEPTFIGSSNSNLDHILVTDELFSHYVPNSVDTMDNLESLFPGYENNTSDHLPVTAQFSFPVVLDTSRPAALPGTLAMEAAYPNPFKERVQVKYALSSPSVVQLTVFDMLGRSVHTHETGTQGVGQHEAVLMVGDLPAGVYLLRLAAAGQATYQRLVRM